MKQHRNVGTVRIVYAQLFAAALLVISCLAISWLSNRIATAQVYGMTDKLYVVNSFIGAFDRCEKAVYDYRWIESWEDGLPGRVGSKQYGRYGHLSKRNDPGIHCSRRKPIP